MNSNEPQQTAEQSMRALIQQSCRGPKDLILAADHPRPTPGPGDYLIRVGAAGANFADVMQAHGAYGGGPLSPYVAGFEAAGTIVGVGAEVECPLPLGTHVVGAGPGAFAQYMAMAAAGVLPVPSGWNDAEALGMVLNWGAALAALKPLGEIKSGDVVLIHAAAGGVGQAAVKLARHYGARVIATASPEKHHIVKALGANDVLDRCKPGLAEEITQLTDGGGADLVLESVGKATFAASMAAAKPFTGRIVVFGAASGDTTVSTYDLVFTHHVTIKGLHIGALATEAPDLYQSLLAEITALVTAGVYTPGSPQIHPLAEGPEVLRQLEAGVTHGKHALDPWS